MDATTGFLGDFAGCRPFREAERCPASFTGEGETLTDLVFFRAGCLCSEAPCGLNELLLDWPLDSSIVDMLLALEWGDWWRLIYIHCMPPSCMRSVGLRSFSSSLGSRPPLGLRSGVLKAFIGPAWLEKSAGVFSFFASLSSFI